MMAATLRIFVNDSGLRDALVAEPPAEHLPAVSEPVDAGFGETLYPMLVDSGILALPAGIASGLITNWLIEAWKRRGKPKDTVAGIELGAQTATLVLSGGDAEQIAKRLLALMEEAERKRHGGA